MTANTSQSLVNLDFTTYKQSLKSYFQGNTVFRDYDFEGSNLGMLLDVLARNTSFNAFFDNMMISESFLDSAQLRSSVVSHAKDLNYLPVSAKSAKATVNVSFSASGETTPYVIPKGSPFSTLIKNKSFVFNTDRSILCTNLGGNTYTFEADIYEGLYVTDVFLFQSTIEPQRFKLSNPTIDTDSIVVTVFENGSQYGDIYTFADTLLGLTPTSRVFFMQATSDGYYEILFGDNIFGRRPLAQALINVNYRTTVGSGANGAKVFDCDFDPTSVGEILTTATTTLVTQSAGGNDKESIESIRTYAPRYFATQQRAVSSDDYKSIILAKFPSSIDDVNPFGGELLPVKRYGYTVIALKPKSNTIVPDYVKQQITNQLLNYVSVPGKFLLIDPEYFYIEVDSSVYYDTSITTKSVVDIETAILTAMNNFAEDTLIKFGKDFRYSRFTSAIDAADDSIISNDTTVRMVKRITPVLNIQTSYNIEFKNKPTDYRLQNEPILTSSLFSFVDIRTRTIYPLSYLANDAYGNISVYTTASGEATLVYGNIGTVDLATGKVQLSDFIVSDYTGYISIYLKLDAKDIIIDQQNILQFDLNDVTLNLQPVVE